MSNKSTQLDTFSPDSAEKIASDFEAGLNEPTAHDLDAGVMAKRLGKMGGDPIKFLVAYEEAKQRQS